MLTLVPQIAVRQVVLAAPGKMSTGTITPTATPFIPNKVEAADVVNAASWTFSNNTTVAFPVAANEVRHLPGSFVKDAIFAAGTYTVCFYLGN